MEIWCHLLICI